MRGPRVGAAFLAALAISAGLITLFGLLLPIPGITPLSNLLLQFVPIIVAVALLVGIVNLLVVHLGRMIRREGGWLYSIFLVLSFVLVIVLVLIERANRPAPGEVTPSGVLLNTVQVSLELALAALLLFALVYGAARMLNKRLTWSGVLFIVVLEFILIAALPLPALQDNLQSVRDWIFAVPVEAGGRGILLGIGLATVVAGVRVLTGQDRSYRE